MLYSCPTQTEQSILGEPCTSMAPQAKHQKKSSILTHVYFYGMWIYFFASSKHTITGQYRNMF